MIGEHMAYVALAVEDPQAAARTFAEDFGLAALAGLGAEDVAAVRVGATALACFPLGHPLVSGQERPGIHHVALAVRDPDDAARQAREEGIGALTDSVLRGLGGGEHVLLDPADTCGVRLALTTPLPGTATATAAPGTVERLDHLGIACADVAEAIHVFSGRLEMPLESTQTDVETRIAYESFTSDQYGVVHHTRAPEVVGGLRAAFITAGDTEFEFLQELDRRGDPRVDAAQPGTTQQDYGAIARYVARRGPGLHHLALKVPDIDRMLARLSAAGHAVIDPVGRPGGRRSQIGFIHPRTLHGVLLHLVQREERA